MGLVLTQELGRVQLDYRDLAGVGVDGAVEAALEQVQVQHPGVAAGSLVDAQQPLHGAVAEPGVAAK